MAAKSPNKYVNSGAKAANETRTETHLITLKVRTSLRGLIVQACAFRTTTKDVDKVCCVRMASG